AEGARPAGRSDAFEARARLEWARRFVAHIRAGPQLRHLLGRLDEAPGLACVPGAVDEAGVELPFRAGDCLSGLPQVGDIVQRVVQAEDVDPALGCGGDEPTSEIRADRP